VKRIAKISTSGIAIVSVLRGDSTQRRTIRFFSATTGLRVVILFIYLFVCFSFFLSLIFRPSVEAPGGRKKLE